MILGKKKEDQNVGTDTENASLQKCLNKKDLIKLIDCFILCV